MRWLVRWCNYLSRLRFTLTGSWDGVRARAGGSAFFRCTFELCPRPLHGLVELLLEAHPRAQFGHIRGHPDPTPVELQEFDLLIRLVRAEDQANRWLLARLLLVLFEPPKIQLHLAVVGG